MTLPSTQLSRYRGRLAPSPTGFLHLGHARTFWIAHLRAKAAGGTLVLRNEDLDPGRSKKEFAQSLVEDLEWFGIEWQEGYDKGGPFAPYNQSKRLPCYQEAFQKLQTSKLVYPCTCSRQDVLRALQAPHHGEDEPLYPGTCREKPWEEQLKQPKINWRFKVPEGEVINFLDLCMGPQTYVAGRDFGDFVVWRHDQAPSYQLAVVVDDAGMVISEVVRGEDLLLSTARQLLLYRSLGLTAPQFYHCELMRDEQGVRLSKRHDALSLRQLRGCGRSPEMIRASWHCERQTAVNQP
ncbi:MAG: tRNA glutamyl-Q(34) synthetase GluQRS [Verrucomicrobiales bacterium]